MTTSSLNIGFIGLGIMGTPMAGDLIAAGQPLFVYKRGPMPEPIRNSGATACSTAGQVAEHADIIFPWCPTRQAWKACCLPPTVLRRA